KEKEPETATAAHAASTNSGKVANAPAAADSTPSANAGATAPAPSMANTPVAVANGGSLAWTAPANWQAKPAGGMRKATFTIPGEGGASAELAVTSFGGDVGGEVANVNRWRGQLQLPPLSDADASAAITRLEANGLKIGVVEAANGGNRLLGAMVPYDGAT